MRKNLLQLNTANFEREFTQKTALYITDKFTARRFSGADIDEGVLIITKNEKVFFTDKRYVEEAKAQLVGSEITVETLKEKSQIIKHVKQSGVKTLYVDFSSLKAEEYFWLKNAGFKVGDAKDYIKETRRKKDAQTLFNIKRACEITQTAYEKTIEKLKTGVTELEIKRILENAFYDNGADGIAFETIVAFGKNSAVPHHKTCDDKLKKGQVVLIDCGCTYKGCCSDLTRTVYFGKADKTFKQRYQAVLTANQKVIAEVKVGDGTKTAYEKAVNVLKESGVSEFFTHALGHGLGYEIHESPSLSPKSEQTLIDGEIFTVEPGVYFEGEYGIRIEDTVMLTEKGIIRLFTDGKELIEINK